MQLLNTLSHTKTGLPIRKMVAIFAFALTQVLISPSCKKTSNEAAHNQDYIAHFQEIESDVLGDVSFENGNMDSAIYYYQKGIPEHTQGLTVDENYTIAMRNVNIGLFYNNKAYYALAMQHFQKALTFFETDEIVTLLDDSMRYTKLASIYNFMAETYIQKSYDFDSIGYAQALKEEMMALKYAHKANIDSSAYMFNAGAAYLNLKDRDNAEKYTTILEPLFVEQGNRLDLASMYNNAARLYYFEQEDYSNAISYLKKAIVTLNKYEDHTSAFYLNNREYYLCNLLEVALVAQNIYEAQEAYDRLSKIEPSVDELLRIKHDKLEELFRLNQYDKQKFRKAYETYKREEQYKTEHEQGKVVEQTILHEVGKKELQIVQQEADIEKQTQQKRIGFVIAAALLALSSLIAYALRQNKKKNKLLAAKNAEIERKNEELAIEKSEVEAQKLIVDKKNNDILESIQAASAHQKQHLLLARNIMRQHLSEYFIFHQPHSIVSGDFYRSAWVDGKIYVLTADCTGHGVRGAFMSQSIKDMMNQVVLQDKQTNPADILDIVRMKIKEQNAHQEGGEHIPDGMDATLCVYDMENKSMEFAGANHSAWILRKNQDKNAYELIEHKGDKGPVGEYPIEKDFELQQISLQSGDVIYTFSDGYQDQFGGEHGKKFMKKSLRELIISLQGIPIKEQQKILETKFKERRGDYEQTDDVLVIGIKIP